LQTQELELSVLLELSLLELPLLPWPVFGPQPG
jgi:hypothetical protein